MIYLTYDRALELLEQVVAGNEDLVYEKPDGSPICSYASGKNTDGCGVGQVLGRLGLTVRQLADLDGVGDVREIQEESHYIEFDDDALKLLSTFQYEQDRLNTWGEALRRAKEQNARTL
jgi:hypothetical protein